jgi:hypothetical protein
MGNFADALPHSYHQQQDYNLQYNKNSLYVDQADMRMVTGIHHYFPAFSDSWTNQITLDFLKIGALPVSHFTTQTAT